MTRTGRGTRARSWLACLVGLVALLVGSTASSAPPDPPIAASDEPAQSAPQPKPAVDEGSPYVWVGWLVSGILGAGAIATGTAALVERSELDDTPPSELQERRGVVTALALATDGLITAAVASAGASWPRRHALKVS